MCALNGKRLDHLPLSVALAYAVVAGGWIVASDTVLMWLGLDGDSHVAVSVAKGLAFVAVTATLLYWLLSRAVAEQRRTLDELESAERSFRRRVEALSHGVVETDAQGRIRFANGAARELLGGPRCQLEGSELADSLLGADALRSVDRVRRAARDSGGDSKGVFHARAGQDHGHARELRFDWSIHGTSDDLRLVFELTDITEWLRASAESRRLSAVLEATTDLVATMDSDGRITYVNAAGEGLLSVDAGGLEGTRLRSRMAPWARLVLDERAVPEALKQGTWTGESALLDADGREIPVSQVIIAHRGAQGQLDYFSTIARDITEQKALDDALYASREQYRSLVENTHDGIAVAQQGRVCYVNPRLSAMLGFDHRHYVGDRSMDFVHPEDREYVRAWYRAFRDGMPREECISFRFLTIDGSVRHVKARASTILWEGHGAVLSFFEDISDRVRAEGRLEYLAEFDALTGLPNRDLLLSRLDQALQHGGERNTVAVVYLNLTRFQIFNDSYGHVLGDRLLRAVAERLTEALDDGDVVARIGGDEFVVLLTGLNDTDVIPKGVRAIFEALREPVVLDGQEFFVNASAGIAVYPDDSDDAQVLLRNAASALEMAKQSGPGAYRYYAAGLNEQARRRLALETDLRHALARGEFEVYFQPQAALNDGSLKGAEALLRWNHGEHGMIMPGDFIPLLEESELILEVGAWVLRRACETQRYWERQHDSRVHVSVNLSARQLDDDALVQRVNTILDETLASPECIELEITESSLVHNPAEAARTLEALKALGLSIAVDDFGTGYSSLSYFRRFPVDTIKIDKAFVAEATSDPDTAEIIRAIIAMGHSLGCLLVAEGVETFGELRFLRRAGCDWMQGYYLARPSPAADFEGMVSGTGPLVQVTAEVDRQPVVLVVGRNPGLPRKVAAALPEDAPAPIVVTSAAEAFERMACGDLTAVVVHQAPEGMDPLVFLSRTRSLYPGVRRLLVGDPGDVLLAAQVGEDAPVQELLVHPLEQGPLDRAMDRALRDWHAPKAIPLRR